MAPRTTAATRSTRGQGGNPSHGLACGRVCGQVRGLAHRPVPGPVRRLVRGLVRGSAVLGFGALIGACGTSGQGVQAVASVPASAADRYDADGLTVGYEAVTPRTWVNESALDVDAPDRYTVVRGDTLWDISDRFLKEPWLWPTIWNYNPQIANPHLIYPGDELVLEYVDGQPTLVLTRNGKVVPNLGSTNRATGPDGKLLLGAAIGENVTRLSPRIRSESLDDAVPTIPGDTISQFLVHPRVVDLDTIRRAPYVLGNRDGHLVSATGNRIYARGNITREQTRYGVYRRSKALKDPITGDMLGYEIAHVADTKLLNVGDPSILAITSNKMETIAGDILLPSSGATVQSQYVPRLPEIRGEARIISLVNAISQTGRDQVVVLNIGKQSDIAIGDVLAIETRGGSLIDPRGKGGHERVELPNIRTGVLMVFETFEKVSYALVMESTRPVMLNDVVTGI